MNSLPRLLIAAPASGSGKTTIVSGLITAMRRRGFSVQPFKIGPDYIDVGYHQAASGRAAYNLDTWLMDREAAVSVFADNAGLVDISLVEGVMGLYDGGHGGGSSTSEIAKLLKIPVVLVIDASSMGESAAAVALGFRGFDEDTDIRGVILNRLGSQSHRRMICEAMERISMPVLGAVMRDGGLRLPERHLGLVPREENNCAVIIEKIGDAIEKGIDIEALIAIANSAPQLKAKRRQLRARRTVGVKIGVARDEAFSFYYPDSISVLEELGAEIVNFSPLRDSEIPQVSGLIFGGGFPEIFASELASNHTMLESVRYAARNGMPIYAECGGYMYLTRSLRDFNGKVHHMANLIPNATVMNERLQTVGYVEATALRDTLLCRSGTVIKGHEFHFSSTSDCEAGEYAFRFRKNGTGAEYMAGYASANVLASYLHLHFSGNPLLAERYFRQCAAYHKDNSGL